MSNINQQDKEFITQASGFADLAYDDKSKPQILPAANWTPFKLFNDATKKNSANALDNPNAGYQFINIKRCFYAALGIFLLPIFFASNSYAENCVDTGGCIGEVGYISIKNNKGKLNISPTKNIYLGGEVLTLDALPFMSRVDTKGDVLIKKNTKLKILEFYKGQQTFAIVRLLTGEEPDVSSFSDDEYSYIE